MMITQAILIDALIFFGCSLINVMLNTVKTIVMYKQNILSSATVNSITYGFYTIIVVLMAGEMVLWEKVVLTAVSNFLGVIISMQIMKRLEKDKTWKIECNVYSEYTDRIHDIMVDVPHYYNEIGNGRTVFNFYCDTKEETRQVKEICKRFNGAKFSAYVSENF